MPADIRWMLKLTAPRVNTVNAYYYRKFELDEAVFRRSTAALRQALRGGRQLTRAELAQALEGAGITASSSRLAYLIMRAELDVVVCSGALRGKQFTYALLNGRVPEPKHWSATRRWQNSRDATSQAMGQRSCEITHGGRGSRWLTRRLASKYGQPPLMHETADGRTYWFATPAMAARKRRPTVHLLPNYDEYLIAYKAYSSSFDAALVREAHHKEEVLAAYLIVLNGQVIGGWRRTLKRDEVPIRTQLLVTLNKTEQSALRVASEHYGRFLGKVVTLV